MAKYITTILSSLFLILFLLPSCSDSEENAGVGPIAPFATEDNGVITIPLENRNKWKVLLVDSAQKGNEAKKAFDNKPETHWHTQWGKNSPRTPHELQIDMGDEIELYGFTYLPRQTGGLNGTIKDYEFFVSNDPKNWGKPVSKGGFNVKKFPNLQFIDFKPTKGRYIRIIAKKSFQNKPWTSCAELNVIVKE